MTTPTGLDAGASAPRRFDPWRTPASATMHAIVSDITAQTLNAEAQLRPRSRARRATDAAIFRRTVEALVCDLAYQHLNGREGVCVTRDKRLLARRSRYRAAILGKQFPRVIDLLATAELAFAQQELGTYSPQGNTPTLLRPGARLLSRIAAQGITLADFGRREGEELIVLKSPKDSDDRAEHVEYEDTQATDRYRAEIRRINAALAGAFIEWRGAAIVDPRDRHLVRRFTRSSFESGGRLWGGFWQSLPKALRLAHTRIAGEPVVLLDYRGMVVRTAYSLVGARPPCDEPYEIPSLPLTRATVKKLCSACLYAARPLTRWPDELVKDANGVPVKSAITAIAAEHLALAPLFFTGIGHRAQFIESEILIDVLLRLLDAGTIALPVHDAIVVPGSALERAHAIMSDCFEAHTKLSAVVTVERPAVS